MEMRRGRGEKGEGGGGGGGRSITVITNTGFHIGKNSEPAGRHKVLFHRYGPDGESQTGMTTKTLITGHQILFGG